MPTVRGTLCATCFVAITALLPQAFGQLPASYTFTLYDVPGAISTQINSINVRGDITGTYTTADSVSHAFVRLAASPGITTFASPDGKAASTPVINSEGQIAFAVGTPGVPGGFFGSTGGFTDIYLRSADGGQYTKLAEFSDADAVVTGVNRLAQLIGYASTFATEIAILLNPDGSRPAIHLVGGRNYGINDAGQVMRVNNSQSFNTTVFLDNPDGTPSGKRLDIPLNLGNAAMSNSGLVAGTFYNSNFGDGFIGDLGTNQYVKLSVPGYEGLTRVNGVNDFGVVVGAVGLTNSPLSTPHGFIATPAVVRLTLMASGVANAASYSSGSISQGEVVVLFGTGLGAPALSLSSVDASGTVATDILATRILINGIPAPLIYASASQVSAVVPYEVIGNSASVEAEFQGQRSLAIVVPITPSSPGIFTLDGSGTGPGVIFNQDGSINTVLNPAKRGDIIVMYATGFGQTAPAGVTGHITALPTGTAVNVPTILQQPLPISVMVGNSKARLLYDGPAPGIVAGVSQINLIVPLDAPFGATVPVTVMVGDSTSRAGPTVALR